MTLPRPETSSQQISFHAEREERLDRAILEVLTREKDTLGREVPTRSQIANWIADGLIEVNGKVVNKAGAVLKPGTAVCVRLPTPKTLHLQADPDVPLRIVHEEESFLVLDKAAGLVVHPGAGRDEETLVHGLLHHFGDSIQAIGDAFRPGVVHRLDKDTSGVMVIAKTEASFRNLTKQLKPPRTMQRTYLALVSQLPRPSQNSSVAKDGQSGTISHRIGRSLSQRTKMSVLKEGGREAVTHWKVREALPNAVLLEVKLETGRTHQIRVHLQATGAPILGDPVYGHPQKKMSKEIELALRDLGRQALHAFQLGFLHPIHGKYVEFSAELPRDMLSLITLLGKD